VEPVGWRVGVTSHAAGALPETEGAGLAEKISQQVCPKLWFLTPRESTRIREDLGEKDL